jgi:GAF domain-containing protein
MTAERDFPNIAQDTLIAVLEAASAREGGLFIFNGKPALMTSVAARGFALLPEPSVIPLLPKHIHALTTARTPQLLTSQNFQTYLSSNGNVAPELFKCVAPLTVGGKLVGMVVLGRHEGESNYSEDELDALALLGTYVALAIHNHSLQQTR